MSGKLRIAVCSPNQKATSETFIANHVNRLEGVVAYLYKGWLPTMCEGEPIFTQPPEAKSFWQGFRFLRKPAKLKDKSTVLAEFLLGKRINVVLAEFGVTGALMANACKKAKIPLVVHFHGFDAYHHETISKYGEKYLTMFSRAAAIIAVSEHMVQQLLSLGAPEEKIHLIPYGVDPTLFSAKPRTILPQTFLAAGRFVAKKAPQITILAFLKVLEDFPEAKLVMAGDGVRPDLFIACKQMVKVLQLESSVRFTGSVAHAEMADLMSNAGVFLQHSVTSDSGDSEGTPNTVLEASASGLAVIATRHAGIPDVIIHGETGYLCEEFDLQQMVHLMKLSLREPEQTLRMGRNGAERIAKNYDLNVQLGKLRRVLEESVG